MKHIIYTFSILLFFTSTALIAQQEKTSKPDALMLRFPDVSADKIVFVYAGDIWTVSKDGGGY